MEKIVMISLLYITFAGEVRSTKFVEIWEPQNCASWFNYEIKSLPEKQRPISGRTYYEYNGYGSEGKTIKVIGYKCSGG
jgi:hypothetical protein|tara:strand:- start:197 stop:433 length:237 start_codon:yes stop_codon:yes gene_type:complete